jgi:hypothetical protein
LYVEFLQAIRVYNARQIKLARMPVRFGGTGPIQYLEYEPRPKELNRFDIALQKLVEHLYPSR